MKTTRESTVGFLPVVPSNVVCRFFHLHLSTSEVKIQGSLDFAGMACATGKNRFAHRQNKLRIPSHQIQPHERSDERVRFENGAAAHQFEDGGVSSMPVDDDHALESVIGKAFADVETVAEQVIVADMHRAWKIEGVNVVPVGTSRLNRKRHNLFAAKLAK
jgi:hypothetical protein